MAGSIVSGGKQADAAKSAAQTQATSAQNALNVQQSQFNTQQQNIAPWLDTGKRYLGQLDADMSQLTQGFSPEATGNASKFDPSNYGLAQNFSYSPTSMTQDPGFQFAMDQGTKALSRSAVASGGGLGGAAAKSLEQYAQGTANQFYNQDYQRAQGTYQANLGNAQSQYQQNYGNAINTFQSNQGNAFNRLASMANVGQTAVGQSNSNSQAFAGQAGNLLTGAGNAQAAGILGASAAGAQGMAGAFGGLSSMAGMQNSGQGFNYLSPSSYTNLFKSSSAPSTNYSNNSGGQFDGSAADFLG